LIIALAALLCSGCAAVRWLTDPGPVTEERGPAERALERALEESLQPAEVPESVRSSLLPPLPRLDRPLDDETRFDVSVDRAPADAFFRSLVDGTPYNVVVHPDVRGEISLELRRVTVPEVIEAVQAIHGFVCSREGDVFYVRPLELTSEVFPIDYLFLKRDGRSQTRVSSGQVSERPGSDSESDTGQVFDGGGGDSAAAVSGSVISTTSQSDLWVEIANVVRAIAGEGGGRHVTVSPSSGTVVVRALPSELREVARYLSSVQASLQRQVVLEAKIVEVTLDDRFRSGINWARFGALGADNTILLSQTGGGTSLDAPFLSEIAGNAGDLAPPGNLLPIGTTTSAFGGVFTATIDGDNVSAFLELLESQGDTQVLSSPRISTLNNQKAVIKVGSDEFFVTDVSTTTVTGTTTTTNPDVTLTPFFSGIALDVTPQIDADGFVTLHVHPSVSEVTDQTKTISIGSSTLSLPLAFSTIRETDSIVRARSGQIIVIGGLMQDTLTDRRASVPFLGRIPLLGALFEHNLEDALKKELVILLRPIVVGPDTFSRALLESVERVDEAKRRQRLGGKP
jgi:MSHA biogenesis protein MshL